MNAGRIRLTIERSVATVEIANSTKRNSLSRAMCNELRDVAVELGRRSDIAAVLLRGADGCFSAGVAIDEIGEVLLDPRPDGSFTDHLTAADEALASLGVPTVAVVDGACIGGGWQIASACDFIIASERSTFALTPARLGIIYPRRGVERLVARIGQANAKYLLLTSQTISARKAESLNLIAEVASDTGLWQRADELLAAVRDASAFSVRTLKQLVDDTATSASDLETTWRSAWRETLESGDMQIGVRAFRTRATPKFTWRPTERR